jgi:hypothetical protein
MKGGERIENRRREWNGVSLSLAGLGEERRERRARFVYQSSRVTARSTSSFHSYYTLINFSLFTITGGPYGLNLFLSLCNIN